MEHQNNITSASAGTTGQPKPARTSLAFRLTCAVAVGLLVLFVSLEANIQAGVGTGTTFAWTMTSLASAAVFVFADFLLPLLVVAIPPGLLVLAVIGLKAS